MLVFRGVSRGPIGQNEADFNTSRLPLGLKSGYLQVWGKAVPGANESGEGNGLGGHSLCCVQTGGR